MKINWRFVWGIFMVAVYLGMAFLLFFSSLFDIDGVIRVIISVLFLLYGIFRGYRMWKNYF